jgi:hypothetical protein
MKSDTAISGKPSLCSDPELVKPGVAGKVTGLLGADGLPYETISDIKPNPTIDNVQKGVAAFRASGVWPRWLMPMPAVRAIPGKRAWKTLSFRQRKVK